jgi:hypothetical protein
VFYCLDVASKYIFYALLLIMISLLSDLMLVLCLLVFIDLYTMLIIFDFFCLFNCGNIVFWENTSKIFFLNRVFICFFILVD